MKTLALLISTLALTSLFSCSGIDTKVQSTLSDGENTKNQPTLAGKVYQSKVFQSANGKDSPCNWIPLPTVNMTCLFINDSDFVQIAMTPYYGNKDKNDSLYGFYYRGIYKSYSKALTLQINSQHAVLYIKENLTAKGEAPSIASTSIQMQNAKFTLSKWEAFSCKDVPYFLQRAEGVYASSSGSFLAPTEDALEVYKADLVQKGIWEKLFTDRL